MFSSWRLVSLFALALLGPGCGPVSGMDAGADAAPDALGLDGGAMDGAVDDAAAGPDADAPSDDGGPLERDADVPADTPELDACAACPTPSNPCEVAVGCGAACSIEVVPDETACGPDGARCLAGVCTPLSCGDGVRETMPREACDDGNNAAGDLCSASCVPTLLVVAAPPGEEAFAPALAEDPSGNVLVVWVEARPATATRERTLIVRGARYSALGVRFSGDPFTIDSGTGDAGVGVGQAITPVVAGRTGGWIVAWRSTFIEGTDADLGGIAFRTVSNASGPALGTLRQANLEERFDQREPAVVPIDGGASFVIGWTDGSDRSRDPGLGVRARVFNAAGTSTSPELIVATDPSGDQSEAALSSGADSSWSVAFTDTSSGMPVVRLRRYTGTTPTDPTPLDLTAGWSSAPRLSPVDGTNLYAAWLDRGDPTGNVGVSITPAGMVPGDVSLFGTDGVRDDGGVIASRASRATVGWRTDEAPQGLRLVPIDWTPPELDELDPLLAGGRQHDLRLLPTATGLWLTWTDESIPDATSAVVAYLLPWD